jgi:hypothetical protein
MSPIEADFQKVANDLTTGVIHQIDDAERPVVSRFFSLWYHRSKRRTLDTPFLQMNGATGARLTKDQEDYFDKIGVVFLREGGLLPARDINGMQLQVLASRYAQDELADAQWGVVRAMEGEFIVPDVPTYSIVPLTPTLSRMLPAA